MSLIDPMASSHLDSCQSEILIDELKERLSNTKHKFVVCVEGNIGCGKTTLLNYFKKTKNCEILAEPVDKWRNIDGHNALELMYKDPHRWGMTLQTYVQLTMLQAHTKVQEYPVKLMERSLYSAKYCFVENLYKSGKMADIDFIVLTEWFNWIIQTQNVKVDLFVYLRTDPEVLFSRIKQRHREEEMGIPLEYLKDLHQLHEDWFIHKKIGTTKDVEVLVIDANSSLEDMEIAYEKHREKILPFISSSSLPVETLEGLHH
nr:thymidine kinase 2; mitochondrial [Biomphalaria glabrata]